MSISESLFVGLFGVTVVFAVLLGLSLLLGLQSSLIALLTNRKKPGAAPAASAAALPAVVDEPLRLINVDEKTAALVMAIVCDELDAEPEELYFKSIRAMGNTATEAQR